MKRKILFIIIVACLIFSVSDYIASMRTSYNKYLSGEYYFRVQAKVLAASNADDWMESVEGFEAVSNIDYTIPKNRLLYLNAGSTVYAYGPHDGLCTVLFGKEVIEDIPISNLQFEKDDAAYFYGTKKYTYKEYIDLLKGLTDKQEKSDRLSDRKMAGFIHVKDCMIVLICFDIAVFLGLFLLLRGENDFGVDLVLIIGALYGIFFEIFTAFTF